MKSSFAGFYSPTEQEFSDLWKDCIFVLDANILLNLYRYPIIARNDFFSVLEKIKEQLWIPHQVGIEYQRNRLNAIDNSHKKIGESLKNVTNAINSIKENIKVLKLEERGLDVSINDVTDFLNFADKKLIEVIRKVQKSQLEQLDISYSDPIRDKIDELLNGRVGVCPSSEDDLNALIIDGESRYANQIPPGFKDSEKSNNYYFNGLKFISKFGDLILWRQLINHAKENNIKKIIFITSDVKEDWWSIDKDRNSMPQPELISEIKRLGNVDLFWMYSAEHFIQNANKFLKTKVSDQTVEEVKNIALIDSKFQENAEISKASFSGLRGKDFPSLYKIPTAYQFRQLVKAIKNFHSIEARVLNVSNYSIVIEDEGKPEVYIFKHDLNINSFESYHQEKHSILNELNLNNRNDVTYNLIIICHREEVHHLIEKLLPYFGKDENSMNFQFQKIIVGCFVKNKFDIHFITENK